MIAVPRLLAGALLALAVGTASAAAQQPAPGDTALTPEQRALQRLRALGAAGAPDTMQAAVDTLRPAPQTVSVSGAGAARPAAEPPSRIERDSVMRLLLTVPEYVATEYQSETARFHADSSRLELRGSAQVAREGSQLVADSLIVYDERIARACGYGQPVLHAVGMTHPLVSDTVCFNVERQIGWALGAETTFDEGATWHLRGEVLVFHGDDLYSHRAIFSDCDLPFPHKHYHFGAGSVKVVRENVLVARDVTLNFQDVPVFWLPFMVQSLSRGRRSGLLMPRFGINDIARTSARYNRRIEDVGVYWAISEYMGAQLALDWFSDNWTGLRGSFDYNFARRFLRGGLTYSQFWKEEGGRDFTLSSQNSWQVDERTSLGINANYVTSTQFVRERTFDPRELNRSIDSHGSLRRRFDWANLTLGASRREFLSNGNVDWTLPSMQLQFSPVTLFSASPGSERWYSNASWQGSTDLRMTRQDVGAQNLSRTAQDRRQTTANVNSGLNVGRFSLAQSFNFDETQLDARTVPTDTADLVLPASSNQRGNWSTSLNFQQRLIGTSTFTPGVRLAGQLARSDATGQELVSSPTRVDFNASLRTELYGFWPGVGGFERFRHKLSPTFSYSYSPALRPDSLQRVAFSADSVLEQSRLSFGINQTFEGKRRPRVTEGDRTGGLPGAAAQPATGGEDRARGTPADTATGPRRREQTAPITLLSIATNVLVYDFIAAREGRGLQTTQLMNSVQSELLQGLQLSFSHDLFREVPAPVDTTGTLPPARPGREFSPHLRNVNASFSLDGDSWLFRVLGLGRGGGDTDRQQAGAPLQEGEPTLGGPDTDRTRSEYGLIGTSRRISDRPRGPVGSWNASFNFSMDRPRHTEGSRGNQMLTTNFSFQPTENWGLRWSTGYSFTTTRFTDHILSLTRTLHDWDASFDFVKAQNGNFSFQFRVHLRANPDVKLDYSQTDAQGIRRMQEPGIR